MNEASANKTHNITSNGTVILPVPANPTQKLVLIRIVVNGKAGTGGSCVIYDSNETLGANGDLKKATLDTVNAAIGNIEYQFPVFNGIYLVIGGGTPPDLTLVYAETP